MPAYGFTLVRLSVQSNRCTFVQSRAKYIRFWGKINFFIYLTSQERVRLPDTDAPFNLLQIR